ncbi:hypothetical protein O1611_g10307 [Lasiodiplodia mahajangana]|uniref:Uncharacterized protein n=1 Tax=Lasiodiplodia mahajangana TaxID=1108764 RepID=A0ACC2IZX6_9PEZI|nr:hypothetical protein O1611_g10307 [Lasiodiplodia mahajangana]
MVLLSSAELTIRSPEGLTASTEEKASETRNRETEVKTERAVVAETEDNNGEDLKNTSGEGTGDLDSEWDWDGETENPEDRSYHAGDRCATGLLVVAAPGEQGKYFRVGVFFSEPRGRGGLQAFQKLKDSTIEII